jgi:hypothetical protein
MLPITATQRLGHPRFLVILVAQKRPATEGLTSHFESVQKATIAGTIWEIFRFD